MDFGQFMAVATQDQPKLEEYERAALFVNAASKDTLWQALTHGGIHTIYHSLLNQALHRRLIEEQEQEQARKRKREEDARLEASKDEPPQQQQRCRRM
jgi:hypothetical protein